MRGVFEIVRTCIKPIIKISGGLLLASLIFLWLTFLFGSMYSFPYSNFILPEATWTSYLGFGNLFFIISIPILIVVLYFWKYMTNNKIPNWAKTSLSLFWLGNLISMSMLGGYIGRQFMDDNSISESEILRINNDTLKLGLSKSLVGGTDRFGFKNNGVELSMYGKDLISTNVQLDILQSNSPNFELERYYQSRGSDLRDAEIHADQIEYNFSHAGNSLFMSPDFLIRSGKKWRNQRVLFVLKVPTGKHVQLPDDVTRVLQTIDTDRNRKKRRHRYGGNIWKMDENGLFCPSCELKDLEYEDTEKTKAKTHDNLSMI